MRQTLILYLPLVHIMIIVWVVFYFDGSNDVITVSDQPRFKTPSGEFTTEFWFYMNDIQDPVL